MKRPFNVPVWAVAIVAVAMAAALVGGALWSSSQQSSNQAPLGPTLAESFGRCEPQFDGYNVAGTVSDDGTTISLQSRSSNELAIDAFRCVLDPLGIPERIWAEISQTRPIDGRQNGGWDGFDVAWSVRVPDTTYGSAGVLLSVSEAD